MEFVWLIGMLLFAASSLAGWIRAAMLKHLVDDQRRYIQELEDANTRYFHRSTMGATTA